MALRLLKQPVSPGDLARLLAAELPPPVAVVAMGSPWRGDDAAGCLVAECARLPEGVRLFSVETAPESFLLPIGTCGAKSCILVDAVDAGASPGDVVLLEPEDLEHTDFTTHGLSPKAFLQALADLSGMRLLIVGIQPGALRTGRELSSPVRQAVDVIAEALALIPAGPAAGDAYDHHARPDRLGRPDPHRA